MKDDRDTKYSVRARRLLALIAALALSLASALPATAATGRVLVSTDGTTFGTENIDALFSGDILLIPGEAMTETLSVWNNSAHNAVLDIAAMNFDVPNASFADSLVLNSWTDQPKSDRSVSLATSDECAPVVRGLPLAAGATTTVELALAMRDVTGTTAQHSEARFDLRVMLHDAAVPDGPVRCSGEPGADEIDIPVLKPAVSAPVAEDIATTGFGSGPLIPLGATLLAGGALLLVTARRRRRKPIDGQ